MKAERDEDTAGKKKKKKLKTSKGGFKRFMGKKPSS